MSPLIIEESPDQAGVWDAPGLSRPALLKMKYIRHRKLGFILFEGSVRHDDLAARLGSRDEIVSAGFVFSPSAELRCLGHSESLNVGAGPTDAADLRGRMLAF